MTLEKALFERGNLSYRLDGDNLHLGINQSLCFAAEGRTDRDQISAFQNAAGFAFVEVFVDCALDEVETRDPKGLYQKARDKKVRAGKIKNLTGIDGSYEAPYRIIQLG